jgi:hypothetical protein
VIFQDHDYNSVRANMRTQTITGQRIRRVAAVAVASTFLTQNFALAICSDGSAFPAGNQGFVFNSLPPTLQNMSPFIFTGTAGSVFVPDNSTFENNDPTNVSTVALNGSGIAGLPVAAVGGHDWQMDQGSTTCKATSTVSQNVPAGTPVPAPVPGQAPSGWAIPPNTTTDCFVLPVAKIQSITITTNLQTGQVGHTTSTGSTCPIPVGQPNPFETVVGNIQTDISCNVTFQNFGVVPLTNQAIVTTCVSANLSSALTPNPANTRLNQLGCAISQLDTGVITDRDQTVAPAYMATASIMGGLFIERLENTPNTIVGDSGRVTADLLFMADTVGIPIGSKLTNAMISPDGHYVAATSIRRDPRLFGCNMPLGDPGRIDKPPADIITFAFSSDTIVGVKCMSQIATSGLQVTLANVWGPDNQPYLGGQRTITTAGTTGGSPGSVVSPTAWPQCIALGKGETFTLPAIYPGPMATALGLTTPAQTYDRVAQLDAAIADVFKNHKQGGCAFGPNAGLSAAPVVQPQSIAVYQASNGNQYLFTSGVGQPVTQTRITQNAVGASLYHTRTYFSQGTGLITGVGVAPNMNFVGPAQVDTTGHTPVGPTGSGSLIAMTDPSGLGLAAQEVMSRLPLCEDF